MPSQMHSCQKLQCDDIGHDYTSESTWLTSWYPEPSRLASTNLAQAQCGSRLFGVNARPNHEYQAAGPWNKSVYARHGHSHDARRVAQAEVTSVLKY